MVICTIDPGLKGCTLIYKDDGFVFIDHEGKDVVDIITDVFFTYKPDKWYIEKQHYLSINKGITATLVNWGRQLGALESLKAPFEIISPQKWQNVIHGIPSSQKKDAHKKAIAMFVKRVYPEAELYTPRGRLLDGRSDCLGMLYYILQR